MNLTIVNPPQLVTHVVIEKIGPPGPPGPGGGTGITVTGGIASFVADGVTYNFFVNSGGVIDGALTDSDNAYLTDTDNAVLK